MDWCPSRINVNLEKCSFVVVLETITKMIFQLEKHINIRKTKSSINTGIQNNFLHLCKGQFICRHQNYREKWHINKDSQYDLFHLGGPDEIAYGIWPLFAHPWFWRSMSIIWFGHFSYLLCTVMQDITNVKYCAMVQSLFSMLQKKLIFVTKQVANSSWIIWRFTILFKNFVLFSTVFW